MNKFFFLILFFFHFFLVRSQDTIKSSISYSIGINRMDFFSGFQYTISKNRILLSSGVEIGVNRTLFQKRFFPRLSLMMEYKGFQNKTIELNPILIYSFSVLNINKLDTDFHYFNEVYGGYVFLVGRRLKYFQSTQIGLMNENFKSNFLERKINVFTIGYFIKIGMRYDI